MSKPQFTTLSEYYSDDGRYVAYVLKEDNCNNYKVIFGNDEFSLEKSTPFKIFNNQGLAEDAAEDWVNQ